MELLALPVAWLGGYRIGEKIGEAIFGKKDNEDNYNDNNIRQINMERERERRKTEQRIEETKREYDYRIRELQRQIRENKEEQRRKELQRQLEEKEKERIQQLKELEERNKKQKATENCKNILSQEFHNSIMNAVNDFILEKEKWL